MDKEKELYKAICEECGVENLTDGEIRGIALLLKERLGQLSDLADIGLGELGHIDANVS